MKKDAKHIIPPCRKCPYKLGYVKTLVNPCPQCKQNGYSAFEQFYFHDKNKEANNRLR